MSASNMQVDEIDEYLSSKAASSSTPASVRPFFSRFQTLYARKLWYQLTLAVEEFVSHPDSGALQADVYEHFVSRFAARINQLQLAGIGVKVARQYSDTAAASAFLERLVAELDTPGSQDAYVYARMEAAHFRLLLGDTEATKASIDACQRILDTFDAVETAVHASFYRVAGDLYKARAEYAAYYKNSLLYLACVNLEAELGPADRVARAHDLAISALLGDSIYNFGELLLHPILGALGASAHA